VLLLRLGGIQNVWPETVTSAYGKVESKNVAQGHRVRINSVAGMNFYARQRAQGFTKNVVPCRLPGNTVAIKNVKINGKLK